VRWKEGVDRRLGIANRSRDRLDQNTEFVKEKVTKIINRKPFYSIYHFPRYRPVVSTFHPSQFNTAAHRLEYTIPSLPIPITTFPTPYYPSKPPLPPPTIPPKMHSAAPNAYTYTADTNPAAAPFAAQGIFLPDSTERPGGRGSAARLCAGDHCTGGARIGRKCVGCGRRVGSGGGGRCTLGSVVRGLVWMGGMGERRLAL
jgi:hypothetical protein